MRFHVGETVGHENYPRRRGTILHCDERHVVVRWDDGTTGDLVFDPAVAYDAGQLVSMRRDDSHKLKPTGDAARHRLVAARCNLRTRH